MTGEITGMRSVGWRTMAPSARTATAREGGGSAAASTASVPWARATDAGTSAVVRRVRLPRSSGTTSIKCWHAPHVARLRISCTSSSCDDEDAAVGHDAATPPS